jgi:predicted phosphate transport protein (TIGR00153 family)
MFKFVFGKAHQVESLIYEYLATLQQCKFNFSQAMSACLLHGARSEDFEFYIVKTHKHESRADDIVQEINDLMYGKALLPESRSDIMGLLEALENLPTLFEHILYMIQNQKITVPRPIWNECNEMVKISLECCDLVTGQVEALFKKDGDLRGLMAQIDAKESHCDHIERKTISKIFDDASIDPFAKLQLRELIEAVGDISDIAERISRRINISDLKRRV